jgi:hypothetical protein
VVKNISNDLYYIDDAVPFVVYKENVPTNRIVVKMQTNVGDVNLGPFTTSTSSTAPAVVSTASSASAQPTITVHSGNKEYHDAPHSSPPLVDGDQREDAGIVADQNLVHVFIVDIPALAAPEARGGRGGVGAGAKVVVEPHDRFPGVFIMRGKDDALLTKNTVPGESVYNEKRVTVEVSTNYKLRLLESQNRLRG